MENFGILNPKKNFSSTNLNNNSAADYLPSNLSIHSKRVTTDSKTSSISVSTKSKPRVQSLLSLCVGVLGSHLEDLLDDLSEIAALFPTGVKMSLLAIARRRGILCDNVLLALFDDSWDKLDISGSEVTDTGLGKIVEMCMNLRALDISQCNRVTSKSVCALLEKCRSLETLRWGGTPFSNFVAKQCISFLRPRLNEVAEDSWEELESKDIASGVQSLHWLNWPSVDEDSKHFLSTECPKIVVNPRTPLFKGLVVPTEALGDVALDEAAINDLDPRIWTVKSATKTAKSGENSAQGRLSKAELFRLAFCERDERLAPKRAKNMRQHQRRANKEFIKSNDTAKSMFLATLAQKYLKK